MTRHEFLQEIDRLGYKIDESMSFNYINNLNETSYKARSISLVEKDTGLSFANIYSRRDYNFTALQKIRYEAEITVDGRIWEI